MASIYELERIMAHDPGMATTRMEVRELTGKLIPEFCFDDLPESRLLLIDFRQSPGTSCG
jgi:hypothetical protein